MPPYVILEKDAPLSGSLEMSVYMIGLKSKNWMICMQGGCTPLHPHPQPIGGYGAPRNL